VLNANSASEPKSRLSGSETRRLIGWLVSGSHGDRMGKEAVV